ncbi:MAG: FAD-dependent oxidoreductase, partial [Acidimicrobiia bacterium]|nr:FAD-dependent oxidoreductase [Acidimicrobiia bacterium]
PVMFRKRPGSGPKVAVIGAGPAGLSAAQALGYAGFAVTIYEAHPYAGGMVGGAIPAYRLPQAQIDQDMAILEELGVEICYGQSAGVDFTLAGLRTDGFQSIFVAVGAQLAKRLNLEGEDADGIMDALLFLRSVREEQPVPIGARVGVIGGRHCYGCGSLCPPGGGVRGLTYLPAHDRPDAGRSRRDPRLQGRGNRNHRTRRTPRPPY